MRRLEAQGVPSQQAEAITAAITEVLNDSLENVSHAFVSRAESQKVLLCHFLLLNFHSNALLKKAIKIESFGFA